MNNSQKQIMSVLNYIKELGIPCEVTLYYMDYPNPPGHLLIDLNEQTEKQMIDFFKKKTDYYSIHITFGNFSFGKIYKNRIRTNQKTFEEIKWYIRKNYGEYITNNERKTTLEKVLGDPTPQSLM